MRDAKNFIDSTLVGAPQCPAGHRSRRIDPDPSEVDIRVVNWLFEELKSICHRWPSTWPDDKALASSKRSWLKAFVAAGINSAEQLQRGVMHCRLRPGRESAWVPTSGEFIAWCRPEPEALGLPSSRIAYRQAIRMAHPAASRDDAHPAVYHAACEVGLYELTRLPEIRSQERFERAYQLTVQALMAGQPLREVPKALPERASGVRVRTPAIGRRALKNLREMLAS